MTVGIYSFAIIPNVLADTLWSNLHFLPSIVNVARLPLRDFYFEFYRDRENPNYWKHINSWWPHHKESDRILMLHFEDLKADRLACVRKIADFLGISVTPELLKIVMERSSFEYMSDKRNLFDGRFEFAKIRAALQIQEEDLMKATEKVREGGGQVGQGSKNIAQDVKDDMEKVWMDRVYPITGCKNYDQLRKITTAL